MASTAVPPESVTGEIGLGGDAVIVEKADAIEAAAVAPDPLPSPEDAAVPVASAAIPAYPLTPPAPKQSEVELDLTQVSVAAAEISKGVVDLASSAGIQAASAVQELSKMNGLTDMSTKFSSWWSTFDPLGEKTFLEQQEREPGQSDYEHKPATAKNGAASATSATSATSAQTPAEKLAGFNLQALFELPASESLIETFPCKLLQTFKCVHNTFIPDFQRSYPGRLFITEQHVCFHVEDAERRTPIVLEHSAIKSVGRQKVKRGAEDALKLGLGSDRWMALHDFEGAEDIESALALLEHLSA